MHTQPPAPTRSSGRASVSFVALAVAAVLAAGVGGYVAQSHRQTELPALEAKGSAPVSTTAAAPAPTPAEPELASEPTPVRDEPAAVEAVVDAPRPASASRRTPEPVERQTRRQQPPATVARAETPSPARPAPAATSTAPQAPARTPEPAPAVEAPAPPPEPAIETPAPAVEAAPAASRTRVSISETFTIPADAVIGLELQTSVSSQTAQLEDRVDARVTRDVKVDGTTVIPAGSRVRGEVIRVEQGGKFKERAELGIAFHTLVLPDGETIEIGTEPVFREGENVARKAGTRIGASAAGGAIIGAIFGGEKGAAIGAAAGAGAGTAVTAAQKNSEARLRAGTIVTVRLTEPVEITLQQ